MATTARHRRVRLIAEALVLTAVGWILAMWTLGLADFFLEYFSPGPATELALLVVFDLLVVRRLLRVVLELTGRREPPPAVPEPARPSGPVRRPRSAVVAAVVLFLAAPAALVTGLLLSWVSACCFGTAETDGSFALVGLISAGLLIAAGVQLIGGAQHAAWGFMSLPLAVGAYAGFANGSLIVPLVVAAYVVLLAGAQRSPAWTAWAGSADDRPGAVVHRDVRNDGNPLRNP